MVEIVEIDLSPLHRIAAPDWSASDLLATILEKWGLRYKVLMNCSPEERVVYDEEFEEHLKGKDEEEAVKEFAERKKAIPLKLYDGYEWAYAIVF